MNIVTQKTLSVINRLTSLGGHVFVLAAAFALLGGTLYVAQAQSSESDNHTTAAQTYCVNITPSHKKLACMDGWDWNVTADQPFNAEDANYKKCEDYKQIDESIATTDLFTTCQEAYRDKGACLKAAVNISTNEKPTRKCPSGTDKEASSGDDKNTDELLSEFDKLCEQIKEAKEEKSGSNSSSNANSLQDAEKKCEHKPDEDPSTEEEIEKLKKDIEDLKNAAEAPLPDNQYGQYVNGANKYQPIRVNRAPGDNNPAVILFHGGGWTADDGAADKFAPKANERGYTTFVATYRLGNSGVYYQLDDTLRAIQHIRNNAGMYGIDPERIAGWGDSAGGSLITRAASTGRSGLKVQVGWSAPTNAYTALFHSPRAFAAGMNHSTCAPTDIGEVNDVLDQLNGTTGRDNTVESTGNIAIDVLTLADQADRLSQSAEEISKKIETEEGQQELSGNGRRLAAKKFLECIDNFNTASPALFAKPGSPPGFFAGFDNDPLVHPGQAFQMRDKLRAIGVPSDVLILPGAPSTQLNAAIGQEIDGENHLGYNEKFVAPTLDFMDKFLRPAQ